MTQREAYRVKETNGIEFGKSLESREDRLAGNVVRVK